MSIPRFSEQMILDGIRSAMCPVDDTAASTTTTTFPPLRGTFVQTHTWRFLGGRTYIFRNVEGENRQYGWCSQGVHDENPGPFNYPFASVEEVVRNLYDMGVTQYANFPNYWPWLLGWVDNPSTSNNN
jgi:hypothetical protein